MPLAPFVESLFPPDISAGSQGGPKFKTEIFVSSTGYEQRSILWSNVRSEYNVAHGIRDRSAMDVVLAFFYTMRGKGIGFRFKDWSDYTLTDELIGTGNGTQTVFNIAKTYTTTGAGAVPFVRDIFKALATPSDAVKVNGVTLSSGYTIDYNNGTVTFTTAPTAGHPIRLTLGEFHVPVRFDIDHLPITLDAWETESVDNIPLVEIKMTRP